MVKFSYWTITPLQKEFLEAMLANGSPDAGLKAVRKDNYWLMMALSAEKDTHFKRAYRSAVSQLENSAAFSKLKNLTDLDRMRNDLFARMASAESGKEYTGYVNAMMKVIAEINKMQEGHIAVQKKETLERKIEYKGVIELGKPREQNLINDRASAGTIDVEHEDV